MKQPTADQSWSPETAPIPRSTMPLLEQRSGGVVDVETRRHQRGRHTVAPATPPQPPSPADTSGVRTAGPPARGHAVPACRLPLGTRPQSGTAPPTRTTHAGRPERRAPPRAGPPRPHHRAPRRPLGPQPADPGSPSGPPTRRSQTSGRTWGSTVRAIPAQTRPGLCLVQPAPGIHLQQDQQFMAGHRMVVADPRLLRRSGHTATVQRIGRVRGCRQSGDRPPRISLCV